MGRLGEICHAKSSETTAGAAQTMSEKIAGVGIIGCGVISAAYLKAARLFPQIEVRGLADLDLERAKARSAEFGPPARTVTELLADPAVDIVLNLTTPAAHLPVALQRDRRRQARLWREAACGLDGGGARACSRRPMPRACASAARPTPSSAAATRARGACSTMARSARRSAAPPFSCWQATSAGIRTPTSTTPARAAGRCSTWAPTTSPIWSSCSGRSPRSWPSARSAARAA